LTTLGIDVDALAQKVEHRHFHEQHGLYDGVVFDAEAFGADRLVFGMGHRPPAECLAQAPLSTRARREIAALEQAKIDYLPGISPAQKKDRLSRMSYEAYLRDIVGVEASVLNFEQG
jgi:spermidine dehydrogenase